MRHAADDEDEETVELAPQVGNDARLVSDIVARRVAAHQVDLRKAPQPQHVEQRRRRRAPLFVGENPEADDVHVRLSFARVRHL